MVDDVRSEEIKKLEDEHERVSRWMVIIFCVLLVVAFGLGEQSGKTSACQTATPMIETMEEKW